MMTDKPQSPQEKYPDSSWEHFGIWERVRQAIYALPLYFKSETDLSGLSATDIFTLNAALGATIEDNVVKTLNEIRSVWDPEGEYKLTKVKPLSDEKTTRVKELNESCGVEVQIGG